MESSTDGGRRHSSPILGTKSDHVAEIARLIGLVSADSQRERDCGGEDNAGALNELKSYLQSWPEAYATLEDQVFDAQHLISSLFAGPSCGQTAAYHSACVPGGNASMEEMIGQPNGRYGFASISSV